MRHEASWAGLTCGRGGSTTHPADLVYSRPSITGRHKPSYDTSSQCVRACKRGGVRAVQCTCLRATGGRQCSEAVELLIKCLAGRSKFTGNLQAGRLGESISQAEGCDRSDRASLIDSV